MFNVRPPVWEIAVHMAVAVDDCDVLFCAVPSFFS